MISPLIALMRDQGRRFEAVGLPVGVVDSQQTPEERRRIWQQLLAGRLRLLLVSPERLARHEFRARLSQMPLKLVAVDEAHCISQWGSHFRPDYRLLGDYLNDLGAESRPTRLALTATATLKVRSDITRSLGLAAPVTVIGELTRANLKLKVMRCQTLSEQLLVVREGVLMAKGSGIVYAPTRRLAADVHRLLLAAGVDAGLYHAGLTAAGREACHRAFADGTVRVVVATNAFGLGIDRGDLRFVHHAGMPGSLEQYVQEVGRAGRDGAPAECWFAYCARDVHIHRFMIDKAFPDWRTLEQVLAHALDAVAGAEIGLGELQLRRSLKASLPLNDQELQSALDVLCREGALGRLRPQGRHHHMAWEDESRIVAGRGDVLRELRSVYPQRREEAEARVSLMRTYAEAAPLARPQLMADYFCL